jgi:hypothetical protein
MAAGPGPGSCTNWFGELAPSAVDVVGNRRLSRIKGAGERRERPSHGIGRALEPARAGRSTTVEDIKKILRSEG